MDLDGLDAGLPSEREEIERIAGGDHAAARRAGDDRAVAGDREGAIDREKDRTVRRARLPARGEVRHRLSQRRQALAVAGRCEDFGPRVDPGRAEKRARVAADRPGAGGAGQVALGDDDDAVSDADEAGDVDVLVVWGMMPSSAATTSTTASSPVAPAIIVRTKRS